MIKISLQDNQTWGNMLPLTFTRSVAGLRVGILTIQEKWEILLGEKVAVKTQDYLQSKYHLHAEGGIVVPSNLIPNKDFIDALNSLDKTEALYQDDVLLAYHTGQNIDELKVKPFDESLDWVKYPWDIFTLNAAQIEVDFNLLTQGRQSEKLSDTNHVMGDHAIFLEVGAKVENTYLNTSSGSIYIGKDAELMEGSLIRGPFSLGEHSVIKMGAKIYEGVTIGPYSKVGGEVSSSVIQGYTNKGHDGFLGNAVIGAWCNLGADTNNSNLKNNYGNIKLWNYLSQSYLDSGLQFCGLIMGDHAKCGINTMFNTGTVVGVGANVFGSGFPDKYIPSFIWGGIQDSVEYRFEKFIGTAKSVMARRSMELSQQDIQMLRYVFDNTKKYRN